VYNVKADGGSVDLYLAVGLSATANVLLDVYHKVK
jgi:hypothetical protein